MAIQFLEYLNRGYFLASEKHFVYFTSFKHHVDFLFLKLHSRYIENNLLQFKQFSAVCIVCIVYVYDVLR